MKFAGLGNGYGYVLEPTMWIEMGWIGMAAKDNASGCQQLNLSIGSSYLAERETTLEICMKFN
jgi:hypothetical protein